MTAELLTLQHNHHLSPPAPTAHSSTCFLYMVSFLSYRLSHRIVVSTDIFFFRYGKKDFHWVITIPCVTQYKLAYRSLWDFRFVVRTDRQTDYYECLSSTKNTKIFRLTVITLEFTNISNCLFTSAWQSDVIVFCRFAWEVFHFINIVIFSFFIYWKCIKT